MTKTSLTDNEFVRYSRQIMLPNWQEQGQLTLSSATVLIIGCGGLGNGVTSYLAGAGVGHLILVDNDHVALSNLPRQLAFDLDSIENSKVYALANRLREQNDLIDVTPISKMFSSINAENLLKGCDLVIDCSDNFSTRYLINRQCVAHHIALLSGSVIGWQGQLLLVDPNNHDAGCYQCVFGVEPDQNRESAHSCASSGVSGPMVGVVSSFQANEALRYLLNVSSQLVHSFCLINGETLAMNLLKRTRQHDCAVCSTHLGESDDNN